MNKCDKEVLCNVKGIKIIVHIALLYGLLLIGNWLQAVLNIAIPGSVIGMLLLFFLLKLRIIKLDWIKEGTQLILKHLTLFFIPVTIGFIDYLELFSGRGILLLLTALLSTALVMGVSGAISQRLARRKEIQHD
ncbi:CidA/LrgA family holin-like protein [Ralstonia pickettii]|nr:CidA/LrgA family holin-like protein [Ralstonia pickettii]